MPGTLIVHPATFNKAIVITVGIKPVYGTENVQDKSSTGVPKWTAAVAVTYNPDPTTGITSPSEVLQVTITSPDDPAGTCPEGTVVTFDQLRAGLNPPEKRENGSIRGGRLYYSAAGLKLAVSSGSTYRPKTDAA